MSKDIVYMDKWSSVSSLHGEVKEHMKQGKLNCFERHRVQCRQGVTLVSSVAKSMILPVSIAAKPSMVLQKRLQDEWHVHDDGT